MYMHVHVHVHHVLLPPTAGGRGPARGGLCGHLCREEHLHLWKHTHRHQTLPNYRGTCSIVITAACKIGKPSSLPLCLCLCVCMCQYLYTCMSVCALQVQVYSEKRIDSPIITSGVDSIGFFDLPPLPNRAEVYTCTCTCMLHVYIYSTRE